MPFGKKVFCYNSFSKARWVSQTCILQNILPYLFIVRLMPVRGESRGGRIESSLIKSLCLHYLLTYYRPFPLYPRLFGCPLEGNGVGKRRVFSVSSFFSSPSFVCRPDEIQLWSEATTFLLPHFSLPPKNVARRRRPLNFITLLSPFPQKRTIRDVRGLSMTEDTTPPSSRKTKMTKAPPASCFTHSHSQDTYAPI